MSGNKYDDTTTPVVVNQHLESGETFVIYSKGSLHVGDEVDIYYRSEERDEHGIPVEITIQTGTVVEEITSVQPVHLNGDHVERDLGEGYVRIVVDED